jgi:hypothetical protein
MSSDSVSLSIGSSACRRFSSATHPLNRISISAGSSLRVIFHCAHSRSVNRTARPWKTPPGCPNCIDGTRRVKSNVGYWLQKVAGNRERDTRQIAKLKDVGWKVFVVWECETRDPDQLAKLAAQIRKLPKSAPSANTERKRL